MAKREKNRPEIVRASQYAIAVFKAIRDDPDVEVQRRIEAVADEAVRWAREERPTTLTKRMALIMMVLGGAGLLIESDEQEGAFRTDREGSLARADRLIAQLQAGIDAE